jgi:AcrR family transcriptional regulator
MATLQLQMNENLFLRDPQDTELGRKIIHQSIKMIDELGIERFTFKRLAESIDSTEASIYRYFENKHKLLVYLIAWYWNWIEYSIDFQTNNLFDPEEKLRIAIRLVTEKKYRDPFFPNIDEEVLQRIVINESDKTYLTKQVDEDNKIGSFRGIKSLCAKISDIILEINPNYEYSRALVSTVLFASQQQVFFAEHLPALTSFSFDDNEHYDGNAVFLFNLIIKAVS